MLPHYPLSKLEMLNLSQACCPHTCLTFGILCFHATSSRTISTNLLHVDYSKEVWLSIHKSYCVYIAKCKPYMQLGTPRGELLATYT
jgi:hypothetical protein